MKEKTVSFPNAKRLKEDSDEINTKFDTYEIELINQLTPKDVERLQSAIDFPAGLSERRKISANNVKFKDTKSSDTDLHDLVQGLTVDDVKRLQAAIHFPSGLSEDTTPINFILNINGWKNYKRDHFFQALSRVKGSLVPIAERIPFLARDAMIHEDTIQQKMKLFMQDLTNEISIDWWRLLLLNHGYTIKTMDHSDIFKFCLKTQVIEKDLESLKICFQEMRRNDMALKMETYQTSFSQLSDSDFLEMFP